MIVVMSCAGSKAPSAGRLRTPDGKPVEFVAHPDLMQESRIDPGLAYDPRTISPASARPGERN